jgi:ABC-type enterobactin transport system permease subunit
VILAINVTYLESDLLASSCIGVNRHTTAFKLLTQLGAQAQLAAAAGPLAGLANVAPQLALHSLGSAQLLSNSDCAKQVQALTRPSHIRARATHCCWEVALPK